MTPEQERPTEEDAVRVAITEQCGRKEPTAAVNLYSQQTWQENFERPWVLPNNHYLRHSTQIEGGGGHIFCRMCVKEKKHGKLLAFKLHVTIEADDPMQVQKYGLITLECHGCGFEQIVPRKPKSRGDLASLELRGCAFETMLKAQAAQQYPGQAGGIAGSAGMGMGNALAGIANNHNQQLFLEQMQKLRENNVIDEQRYKEFVAAHIDDANRRVSAVNPPIMSPLEQTPPRRGFFKRRLPP